MFTLGDLMLAHTELRLVTETNTNRSMTAMCRLGDGEVADWFVIVDGAQRARGAAAIHQLTTAGAVLWHGDSVPPEVVSAAGGHGIPLVQLPESTPLTEIYAAVAALGQRVRDTSSWRKLTAIDRLSSALMSRQPEAELISEYTRLTNNTALLTNIDGDVVASTGQLPARTLARVLRGRRPTTHSARIGRWAVTAIPITAGDGAWAVGDGKWFVIGVRAADPPLAHDPVALAAQKLLLVATESRRQLSQAETMRATSVVASLIYGDGDIDELVNALVSRGFSRDAEYRIIAAGNRRKAAEPGVGVAAAEAAARSSAPLLLAPVEGRLVAVVESGLADDAIAAALPEPVGMSQPFGRVRTAQQAWRQAKVAQLSETPHETVRSFDDCAAFAQAAALLDAAALAQCVRKTDTALDSLGDGYQLANALMEENFVVKATAKRMGVHMNTVRNRLDVLYDERGITREDIVMWHLWRQLDGS
ncbi:helix-turn-helix domain-containing protein [Corynebacterium sp. H113]|uniref:helix-turn-helix domain-containing protein n=1 Tax=Corynebacterium sp. H113 TaxID=3133419 RepID=UPI00309AEFB9